MDGASHRSCNTQSIPVKTAHRANINQQETNYATLLQKLSLIYFTKRPACAVVNLHFKTR